MLRVENEIEKKCLRCNYLKVEPAIAFCKLTQDVYDGSVARLKTCPICNSESKLSREEINELTASLTAFMR